MLSLQAVCFQSCKAPQSFATSCLENMQSHSHPINLCPKLYEKGKVICSNLPLAVCCFIIWTKVIVIAVLCFHKNKMQKYHHVVLEA